MFEARHEYDAYVQGVHRLLASGATAPQLAEHLIGLEEESMGLKRRSIREVMPAVRKLMSQPRHETHLAGLSTLYALGVDQRGPGSRDESEDMILGMSRFRRYLFCGLAAAITLVADARSQWSDDPATNLVVADRSGEQVQTKVVPTADGGCFVSWFDNSAGGYDVYLQRLDAAGVELWDHNGVLVADRGFSSTQDYGLAVDTGGNALLAFRDDSGANVQIAAAKVDPDGALLWGVGGIQLTSTTDFVAAPKIAGTTDGNIVVAWTQDVNVVARKLDANGSPFWSSEVVLAPASGSFSASDLQAANAGNAIVSFVHSASGSGPRHLWAQKLASADGASLWAATHVKVYDNASGSLQFGNFPSFLHDDSGGAVFAWYTSSPSLQCRAQRILAAGTEAFAHNGVEASTDGSRLRVSPAVAWSATAQEIFLFWTELNGAQSQFGLYGQKLDVAGVRQWGASGKELVPLAAEEISQVRTLPWSDGAAVAWAETLAFGNQPLHATRVDASGDFIWAPTITDLATSATGTSRLTSTSGATGFAIFAWSDGASGTYDVLAQNLNQDGTLGAAEIFSDGFESGDLSAWSSSVP